MVFEWMSGLRIGCDGVNRFVGVNIYCGDLRLDIKSTERK